MSGTKRCPYGAHDVPVGEFTKNASNEGGLDDYCQPCRRLSRAALSTQHVAGMVQFGAPLEQAAGEAYARTGSFDAAAAELGITPRALRARLQDLARQAARRGWAPGSDMTRTVPEGFAVKGVSTMYGADGEVRAQWVKSDRSQEHRLELLAAAIASLVEPLKGAADPVPMPMGTSADYLNCVPIGDMHFGMLSWAKETGAAFDLGIAERNTVTAFDHLMDIAPPADECLVIELGDGLHADSNASTTTKGTRVDMDSRLPKVTAVAIRTLRHCIDRALTKHKRVTAAILPGNHDANSALMLQAILLAIYEREPRVTVDDSPGKFFWHRFGKCLLGATHGDTVKFDMLPGVMACDRAVDWGETTHRKMYLGHYHHTQVKEYPGVTIETMRTLAPSDAWHHGQGYRASQDLRIDTWHREYGLVNRHIVGIQRVRALSEAA